MADYAEFQLHGLLTYELANAYIQFQRTQAGHHAREIQSRDFNATSTDNVA